MIHLECRPMRETLEMILLRDPVEIVSLVRRTIKIGAIAFRASSRFWRRFASCTMLDDVFCKMSFYKSRSPADRRANVSGRLQSNWPKIHCLEATNRQPSFSLDSDLSRVEVVLRG